MRMFSLLPMILALAVSAGCDKFALVPIPEAESSPNAFLKARHAFTTKLLRKERDGKPAPPPPPELFQLVHYPSPAGSLAAYVGVRPPGQTKHPAIIWIVGGFGNGIDEIAWTPGARANDQSATAFREAGVVMMYPSFRGGNDNPGAMETFYGEVDDVLAAAEFLAKLDYVDPHRIYLGGHSTGGTLALLAAECSSRFRAVFAFGPAADVRGYGKEVLPFDLSNRREIDLRAPWEWLLAVRTPTFLIEGASGGSNIASLRAMAKQPHSPYVRFLEVAGADHFSTLAPLTRLIARKIVADTGEAPAIGLTSAELLSAMEAP